MLLFACLICKCPSQEQREETDPHIEGSRGDTKVASRKRAANKVEFGDRTFTVATWNLRPDSTRREERSIKVISQLELSEFYKQKENQDKLQPAFTQLTDVADIICLQGVYSFTEEELQALLPDYSIYQCGKSRILYPNSENCCAIAWKKDQFTKVKSTVFRIKSTEIPYVLLKDKQTGGILRICSFEFTSNEDDFQEDSISILEHFEKANYQPHLTVLGMSLSKIDFRMWQWSQVFEDDTFVEELSKVYVTDHEDTAPTYYFDYQNEESHSAKLDYIYMQAEEGVDLAFEGQEIPDDLHYGSDENPSYHSPAITQITLNS